ncbi:trypsin-like [Pectinophora gossypiella]|uniref:trypsin-like n=1 Tax=Pectinophora gossypiella TaxID=13191 RepID=UPI00214E3CA5|nr:trypsin-like [Pectinophora gossypiella]
MKGVTLTILCACAVSSSAPLSNLKPLKDLAGVDGAPGHFLYVVTLSQVTSLKHPARICTGNLIASNWVITTAHCSRRVEIHGPKGYKIIYNQTQTARVLQAIVHSGYKQPINESLHAKNDIGLLLITEVEGAVVGKLSPVDYRSLIGRFSRYIGAWGSYTNFNHMDNPKYSFSTELDQFQPLQIGETVVMACKVKGLPRGPWVCVEADCSKYRQDSLRSDSGGPLILDGKIVAIGQGCVNEHTYIYTAVSPCIDWIMKTICNSVSKIGSKRRTEYYVPRVADVSLCVGYATVTAHSAKTKITKPERLTHLK